MYNFNVVKKGYNSAQVDTYINDINNKNKSIVDEKTLRVEELRNENYNLQKELMEYKKREDNVNQALITAVEKSKELEYSIKIRFELEYERLKLFRNKWEQYIETLFNNNVIVNDYNETLGTLKMYESEFKSSFLSGLSLNNSSMPTEQINDDLSYDNINAQYIDESKRIIEKALNTSQNKENDVNSVDNNKDLHDLCAKLGLI